MFDELKQEAAAAQLKSALAQFAFLVLEEGKRNQSISATVVFRDGDFDYHFDVSMNGLQVQGGSL